MEPIGEMLRRVAKAARAGSRNSSGSIKVRGPVNVRRVINVGSHGSHQSATAIQSTEIRQESGRPR
jgi:hypothetical protein